MYYLKDSLNLDKDIKEIALLDKACFTSEWDEKQWLYEANENPVSKVLVLKDNDKVIAYLDYWITFDSSTIAKICVDPDYRKKGLASQLLDQMNQDLKENEVLYVTLEVRVSNEAAINLYQKYGFKAITVKAKYYADGEDALYMVREVK